MYREVISATLQEIRPGIEVFAAEPEDLERKFSRLQPQLVVCSRLTKRVEREAPVWVELYPDGASQRSWEPSVDPARSSPPWTSARSWPSWTASGTSCTSTAVLYGPGIGASRRIRICIGEDRQF